MWQLQRFDRWRSGFIGELNMQRVNADEIEFGDDYVYRLQSHPFTGVGFEMSEDGRLVSEIEFRDGMKNGMSREWSCDGKLVFEHCYVNNTRHGPQREWSDSGALVSEEDFEHGICTRRKTWNDDGTPAGEYELDESDQQFKLLESIRAAVNQER